MQNKSTYLSEIPTDQKSLSERIERNKNMIGKAINHGSVAVTYSDLRARAYDNLLIIGELQAENQALLAKNGELAKQIDEEKLRTFVHQADSNCAKNDRQSDRVFYQKCLKNVKFERDCLKTKVKELEGKVEEARKLIWHEDLELIDCLTVRAQTLVTALEDEKSRPKPEPKTDMKKERVDPEIEIGSHWQSIDGKVITIDFVKNDLVVWTYEFNDREQITLSTNKEIFIKDFKELKRK